MATHSSTLARRIPWTQEPGGLPSTGSHRVGHDWNELSAVVVWQIHSYYSISCGQDTSPSVSSCVNQMGACMDVQLIQSCPTLCDPVNCSPPGSSVHGILQARILEQVAMPSSRGIFPTQGLNPHLLHWRQILYPLSHLGSPTKCIFLILIFEGHALRLPRQIFSHSLKWYSFQKCIHFLL